jgi:hypothetical protein
VGGSIEWCHAPLFRPRPLRVASLLAFTTEHNSPRQGIGGTAMQGSDRFSSGSRTDDEQTFHDLIREGLPTILELPHEGPLLVPVSCQLASIQVRLSYHANQGLH